MIFYLSKDGGISVDEWAPTQEFSQEVIDRAMVPFLHLDGDLLTIHASGQTARYRVTERRTHVGPDDVEGKRSVFAVLESVV